MLTRPSTDEVLLQARERDEHGTDVALLRIERELAEQIRRDDTTHGQSQRASDLVAATVQRLERDIRWTLHPHQDHAVRGRLESASPAPGSHTRLDWTDH